MALASLFLRFKSLLVSLMGWPDVEYQIKLSPNSIPASIDLTKLTSREDLKHVLPIKYAYNPVPEMPPFVTPYMLQFPRPARAEHACFKSNAILLRPQAAGVPYRSSINHVCQAKFWRENLDETIKILKILAADKSAEDVAVRRGLTIAGIAQQELRPGLEERIVLGTSHIFAAANERRIRHIANLMVLYFVYDDKFEEAPESKLSMLREDYGYLFKGRNNQKTKDGPWTPFQQHMFKVVEEIQKEDGIEGNGGQEMLDAMIAGFVCIHPPPSNFKSVNEYLEFRNLNVGARFVIAAAKYSVRSSVDSSDPRFARYLRLISDHLGIVNDIASYRKELKALNTGDTEDMINMVDVMKNLLSLPNPHVAVYAAYAYQLQIEQWLMDEINFLAKTYNLTNDEWAFLEATLVTATGNVFFCMSSSRYGGPGAMLKS